jgi:Reverse transcriptase (RNA-dependent DNA polymerase)
MDRLRSGEVRLITLAPGSIKGLDLVSAFQAEITDEIDLLPPLYPVERLAGFEKELAKNLTSKLSAGFPIETPEVLQVRKAKRGIRPVPILTLEERTLYRALVDQVASALPKNDRRPNDYEAFKAAPLADPGVSHIVMADVHAYYQYVDHALLRQEIIDQCGEFGLAEALTQFLSAVAGRSFGIPQGHGPSDVLGEVLADVVERRMLRQGIPTWRYVDDFRMAAVAMEGAGRALDLLDEEVRSVALTLNEEKTRTMTRDEYLSWTAEPEQFWDSLEGEALAVLRDVDPYGSQPVEIDDLEVATAAAEVYLPRWSADGDRDKRYGYEATAQRHVLGNCFTVLQAASSPAGIAHAEDVINEEPNLTPRVCGYLAAQALDHPEEISDVCQRIITSAETYTSPWQALWVMEVMRSYIPITEAQQAWALRHFAGPGLGVVSANAAVLLVGSGSLNAGELAAHYHQSSAATRPTVAYALSLLDTAASESVTKSIMAESPMNRRLMTDPDDIPF